MALAVFFSLFVWFCSLFGSCCYRVARFCLLCAFDVSVSGMCVIGEYPCYVYGDVAGFFFYSFVFFAFLRRVHDRQKESGGRWRQEEETDDCFEF